MVNSCNPFLEKNDPAPEKSTKDKTATTARPIKMMMPRTLRIKRDRMDWVKACQDSLKSAPIDGKDEVFSELTASAINEVFQIFNPMSRCVETGKFLFSIGVFQIFDILQIISDTKSGISFLSA